MDDKFKVGDLVRIRQKFFDGLGMENYDAILGIPGVVTRVSVTGTDPQTGHEFCTIHAQFINGERVTFYDFVYEHIRSDT